MVVLRGLEKQALLITPEEKNSEIAKAG